MKQKEKSNDLSNNILDNSGDVESLEVNEKALEEVFLVQIT